MSKPFYTAQTLTAEDLQNGTRRIRIQPSQEDDSISEEFLFGDQHLSYSLNVGNGKTHLTTKYQIDITPEKVVYHKQKERRDAMDPGAGVYKNKGFKEWHFDADGNVTHYEYMTSIHKELYKVSNPEQAQKTFNDYHLKFLKDLREKLPAHDLAHFDYMKLASVDPTDESGERQVNPITKEQSAMVRFMHASQQISMSTMREVFLALQAGENTAPRVV